MITIKPTQNPTIIKFELDHFITNENYEYKNIDETQNSPLAQKLFYLPFVKTVYISGNFIAIERFNIVNWEDVQEDVAHQIKSFIEDGGKIVAVDTTTKKNPITIYGEATPNPEVLKFVCNKKLTSTAFECKDIAETQASPLATQLFQLGYVKELFIDENYISITKQNKYSWQEITSDLRTFIKNYIEQGGTIIDEAAIQNTPKHDKQKIVAFDTLDSTSQQIINILEEYVKPAVAADGGNILFDSYDASTKNVKVMMQGSCNGCPSSTFTLKNGIENMLKSMLNDSEITVEAI